MTTTTGKTVTIVRQVDDRGEVVSETVTTVETTRPDPPPTGQYL